MNSPSPETSLPRSDGMTPVMTSVRWASLLMILASMTIVTARLCHAPVLQSANDRSRWCTVWSLVERNTYQIDEIRQRPGWDSIDIVRHEGHFYSSKPALLPRIVAEMYRGLKAVTGWTLTGQTEQVTRTLLFLLNIVPMGIALWVLSGLLRDLDATPFAHLFVMATACFGTMLLPYLTVFNNHNIAASCFLISIPLAIRCLNIKWRRSWYFAACGFLTAFGVCNELPAALLGIALFLLLVRAAPKQTLALFVPAAIVPLAAFFITNYAATGSFKPFYSGYGTSLYEFVHEGVPSYWSDPKGIDRPRDSTLTYLLHCTIGHHGIWSLSPVFLLTLWGWSLPSTYRDKRTGLIQLTGLLLTLVTLCFYLSRTENYNYSGVSVALRWILWLIPFWLLAMWPVINTWGSQVWFRGVAAALLTVSIFSAWYPSNAPWTKNWIYQLMEQAKWIDYSDPRPEFQRTHYTWLGTLPDGDLKPNYWVRFANVGDANEPRLIELRDAGPGAAGQRLVRVQHFVNGQSTSDVTYLFDVARFSAGAPVEEFLVARQDGQSITDEELLFFRGMPRRMQYVLSRIRYEKTPLRTDAFRCHICYTNMEQVQSTGEKLRLARDIWLTEELPFGVLKWDERVESRANGELIRREIWRAVTAGEFLPRPEKSNF